MGIIAAPSWYDKPALFVPFCPHIMLYGTMARTSSGKDE